MVKHTQTTRRQFADELFECVWPFVKLALKGLKGEELQGSCLYEARSDVNAQGFRSRRRRPFFDIRITDPNAQYQQSKTHMKQTNMKKRKYNFKILNAEQGLFITLVPSITGGIGKECTMFIQNLANWFHVSVKKNKVW